MKENEIKLMNIKTGKEYKKGHKEEIYIINGKVYSYVPYIGEYKSIMMLDDIVPVVIE